jgi:heat shock protein HtpX
MVGEQHRSIIMRVGFRSTGVAPEPHPSGHPDERAMPETPEPILGFRRIEANTWAARLLLASFPLALLPVLLASTVLLAAITRASLLLSLIVSTLFLIVAIAYFIASCGPDKVLQLARARPLGPGEEMELVRTVENLCIPAGLPFPAIHLIESPAPNALATGRNPEHASLVVTRGLLTLLDRRELEGVIAHELSHIGNYDTRLTTMLAALVGIACFPVRACEAAVRLFYDDSVRDYGDLVTRYVPQLPLPFLTVGVWLLSRSYWLLGVLPKLLPQSVSPFWVSLSLTAAPFYVLVLSPMIALLIRRALSHQRDLLADADAVRLTLDPEGLVLALTKVSAAQARPRPERSRGTVGEGCLHLYFVDPLERSPSLLHDIFPSHPHLLERIHLLARMGSIEPSVLDAAWAIGRNTRQTQSESVDVDPPPRSSAEAPDPRFVVADNLTAVYEQPDGWSRVLTQLTKNTVVTAVGREGNFVRVITKDNVAGYVASSAGLPGPNK